MRKMLYPCQLRVVPFGNNAATQFWGYNISTVIVASLVTLDIGQRGLLLAQLLLALPDDPPSHPTGLRDRQRERERQTPKSFNGYGSIQLSDSLCWRLPRKGKEFVAVGPAWADWAKSSFPTHGEHAWMIF